MIKSLLAIPLALMVATPAMAGYSRPGGTRQATCYKEVYREVYVPGNQYSPGYVKRYNERVRVPCNRNRGGGRRDNPGNNTRPYTPDDNSCIEGAVLGGIAGGALGAGLSRDEGNLIGIPLGIVGGALVGCQVDGG